VTEPSEPPIDSRSTVGAADFTALTKHSLVFAIGAVAGKAVGLVLLPLLARLLTPASLGSVDVLMSLGTAATAALLLGVDVAALRLYFDQPDPASRQKLISTWLVFDIALSGAAALLVVTQATTLSEILFGTTALQLGVAAIAVIVVAQTLQTIALTVLRADGRAWRFVLLSGGVLVVYGLLAVILLTQWRADPNSVMIAWATALVVSAAVGLFSVRRSLTAVPSAATARELLRLGLPLAPGVTAAFIADFVNRAILLAAGGAAEVGYFTVALRFASIAGLIVTSFQLAWQPHAFSLGTGPAARARVESDGRRIVIVVAIVVVGIAALAPELVGLVAGDAYIRAVPALRMSLIATIGTALFLVASVPRLVSRQTKSVGLALGLGVAVGIGANMLLAPLFGATGTAGAVAAGQMVGALAVGDRSSRRASSDAGARWTAAIVLLAVATVLAFTLLLPSLPFPVRLLPAPALAALVLTLRPAPWQSSHSTH
jgi:O-antigen/teichoic acid export membrane protein